MSQTSIWNYIFWLHSLYFFHYFMSNHVFFLCLFWFLNNQIIEKLTNTTFLCLFFIICFTWCLLSTCSKPGADRSWKLSLESHVSFMDSDILVFFSFWLSFYGCFLNARHCASRAYKEVYKTSMENLFLSLLIVRYWEQGEEVKWHGNNIVGVASS